MYTRNHTWIGLSFLIWGALSSPNLAVRGTDPSKLGRFGLCRWEPLGSQSEFINENKQARKEKEQKRNRKKKRKRHRQLSRPTNIEKKQRSSRSMEKQQRDKHPPEAIATATQRTIIAPRFTNHGRNASPSPHAVPTAVINNHDVGLAA